MLKAIELISEFLGSTRFFVVLAVAFVAMITYNILFLSVWAVF